VQDALDKKAKDEADAATAAVAAAAVKKTQEENKVEQIPIAAGTK
jgi:hypothetical protein